MTLRGDATNRAKAVGALSFIQPCRGAHREGDRSINAAVAADLPDHSRNAGVGLTVRRGGGILVDGTSVAAQERVLAVGRARNRAEGEIRARHERKVGPILNLRHRHALHPRAGRSVFVQEHGNRPLNRLQRAGRPNLADIRTGSDHGVRLKGRIARGTAFSHHQQIAGRKRLNREHAPDLRVARATTLKFLLTWLRPVFPDERAALDAERAQVQLPGAGFLRS